MQMRGKLKEKVCLNSRVGKYELLAIGIAGYPTGWIIFSEGRYKPQELKRVTIENYAPTESASGAATASTKTKVWLLGRLLENRG